MKCGNFDNEELDTQFFTPEDTDETGPQGKE